MNRSGSVGELLYNDAMKREEKLKEKRKVKEDSETSQIRKGIQPIKSSNQMVIEKVKKEFKNALTSCEI